MDAIVEVQAFLSGKVQGVSCRYNVKKLADRFKVFGFVRNLEDGRVEILAHAEEDILKKFLLEVAHLPLPIQIEKMETAFKPFLKRSEGRFIIL